MDLLYAISLYAISAGSASLSWGPASGNLVNIPRGGIGISRVLGRLPGANLHRGPLGSRSLSRDAPLA
jgi:hypothetical protein